MRRDNAPCVPADRSSSVLIRRNEIRLAAGATAGLTRGMQAATRSSHRVAAPIDAL